jgi:hypothetical protein
MRKMLMALIGAALSLVALPAARAAGDAAQPALQADRDFVLALAKGDAAAVGALLDADLAWSDATGTTRSRRAVLKDLAALRVPSDGGALQTHFYGGLLTVLGSEDKTRFLRVWVKRKEGWHLLALMDTPVAGAQLATVEAAAGQGDCDNPCRVVPYRPKGKEAQAILAAWQVTKMDEWHPNAADWATHIADEFMIVNNTAARNKTERVAIAAKQQASGVGAPGDPVTSMRILTFGTAALMVSDHTPYRGGKPYRNIRIWVKRDGRWLLALSQQVSIQSAAPVPAVAVK